MGFWKKAYHLYYDGFREMTLGRTLWLIIGIKLVVIFLILKLFFFHDYISEHSDGDDASFVAEQLVGH